MSTPNGHDRLITTWLEEQAPMREPDGLLEATTGRIEHTRRLPGPVLLERWIPMQTQAKFGAIPRTAIILITLGLLALLLAAIAVGSQPRPAPRYGLARNGDIILNQDGHLMAALPDSARLRELTSGTSADGEQTMINDGTRVVFTRKDDDASTFWIADPDGQNPMVLASGRAFTSVNDWWPSPDGSQLAVVSPSGAQDNLTIIPTDGSVPLTPTVGMSLFIAGWEPDGTGLLVGRMAVGRDGFELYEMTLDGAPPTLLKYLPGGVKWVAISSDMKRVVYTTGEKPCCGSQFKAWIMNADGSGERRLTDSAAGVWEDGAFLSPDGSRVAITSAQGGELTVVIVDPDGARATVESEPIHLSQALAEGMDPDTLPAINVVWAPDGRSLLVWRSSDPDIAVVDATTGAVTSAPWTSDDWPTWQRLAP